MNTYNIDELYEYLISSETWLSNSGNSSERKVLLQSVLAQIQQLNGTLNYSLSVNEMAVWLPSELNKRFTNFIPTPFVSNASIPHIFLQYNAPDSINWAGAK